MIPHGFLGSRADLLMDLALVTFILLPALMVPGFRLAAARRYERHRTVQTALFGTMTFAVLVLELDLRLRGGSKEIVSGTTALPPAALKVILLVHVAIAFVTWVAWAILVFLSRRRFRQTLPGSFG